MKRFGLTDEEAAKSRAMYGDNRLTEKGTDTFWKKLKDNFGDPMIKILCVALIINVVLAAMGHVEWFESVGIAVAVILATFVSTFSEYRNENSFQKLQEQASKIICKVYRNGEVAEISIDDIVKGDCILLQSGDKIPADGILLDGRISVDQAVLNGESEEALKTMAPEGYEEEDKTLDFLHPHKVFRGTIACSGNAVMEVTTVGDQSVYGTIASELQAEDDRESPLKVKLGKLAGNISRFGYVGGLAIAVALLFQRIVVYNQFEISAIMAYCSDWALLLNDLVDAVILAVIIIVMAVPEGLPLMIAIVSAQNMGKMLKDNVLVREINGIETAGSLNILFSDKTGTITKGHLEAVNFVTGSGKEYAAFRELEKPLQGILQVGIVENSTAVITHKEGERKIIGGNGTDRAVLGFLPEKLDKQTVKRLYSIPFNSENKYSAVQISGDYDYTLIKGAPEKIISRCNWYFDENGMKQPLDSKVEIEQKINQLANRAIRVLGFAMSEQAIQDHNLPQEDYIFVGIMGIRDEVRLESAEAIREVQQAGVQVVMITGDRKDTAVAIAKESGLLKAPEDLVLTSDEMQELSDETLKDQLKHLRVVARALPSDKSRLVRLAQELNLVVGMTGDGVNDSPALKKADVGFAMGSGTEVAKEASGIVILDDNFTSIDKAILYGRTIFNSIRKFIIFQLTINVTAVFISFIAPLLGMENPLSITQILWINLVMDTLAALAFGGEPALKRFMQEKPKKRDEPIVNRYMWSQIFTCSFWVFTMSLVFLITHWVDRFFRDDPANRYMLTGYFAYFIISSVFNAFNARTDQLNLFDNLKQNPGFLRVMALIVSVQLVMTYVAGDILRCYGLTVSEWAFVILFAFTIVPVDLIRKMIVRNKQNRITVQEKKYI